MATIYRLKQTKTGRLKDCTQTPLKHTGSLPKKLSMRDERHLLWCIPVLRGEDGIFARQGIKRALFVARDLLPNQPTV